MNPEAAFALGAFSVLALQFLAVSAAVWRDARRKQGDQ